MSKAKRSTSEQWYTDKARIIGTQRLPNGDIPVESSICQVWDNSPEGHRRAHLIAAAPDLLAACVRMVRASENHGSRTQMMNAAMIAIRAAIAKAEGGLE